MSERGTAAVATLVGVASPWRCAYHKGAKIGVTAPGSSTNMIAQFLLIKSGPKADDATFVGVGGGASAVSAIERGEIDAIANVDPVIAKLEASGKVVVMADTRTTEASDKGLRRHDVGGGRLSVARFLAANPKTVQALVNTLYQALLWMQKASPEQIADSVPQEYWLGDKALYLAAEGGSASLIARWHCQRRQPRALAEFSAATRHEDRRRAHRPRQDLGRRVCRGRGKAQLTCARSARPRTSWCGAMRAARGKAS
jgi:NMT1-like family